MLVLPANPTHSLVWIDSETQPRWLPLALPVGQPWQLLHLQLVSVIPTVCSRKGMNNLGQIQRNGWLCPTEHTRCYQNILAVYSNQHKMVQVAGKCMHTNLVCSICRHLPIMQTSAYHACTCLQQYAHPLSMESKYMQQLLSSSDQNLNPNPSLPLPTRQCV